VVRPARTENTPASEYTLYMAPLSDEEYLALTESHSVLETAPDGTLLRKWKLSQVPNLFQEHVRRAPDVTIGGVPFDPARPEHVASIPPVDKATALLQLIVFACGLTEDERGNSTGPDASSTTGEIQSQD
jgi:hypothetical protein